MMSADQATDGYSAVYFLEGDDVARQMRASEYGAFLDGYVGLSDLAETDVRAVLVELSPDLRIQALVFFRIWFDDEGRADSAWNVPIEELAKQGAPGSHMGGDPIRLVCRSQCPDPRFKAYLWDPDMTSGKKHFQAIRKAVEANSLRFRKMEPVRKDDIPVLSDQAPDFAEPKEAAAAAHPDWQQLHKLRSDVARLEQTCERQRLTCDQLKKRLEQRQREVQLRDERIASLEAENNELQNREPPEGSIMAHLKRQSAFLVAYQPGAGHMTLPLKDIETYFHNPTAYAAQRCDMSESAYRQWSEHYDNPICSHEDKDGNRCGKPVRGVSQPVDFRRAIDDRCDKHQG